MGSRGVFDGRGFVPLLLLLVGLASFSSVASLLKCYDCKAYTDCTKTLGKEEDCKMNEICSSFLGKYLGDGSEQPRSFRSCLHEAYLTSIKTKMGCYEVNDVPSFMTMLRTNNDGEVTGATGQVCFCNTDLCNKNFGSTGQKKHQPGSIKVLITVTVTVSIAFYLHRAIASP